MQFSVLGSGSRGNSVYIESGKTGILIDAGFSGKELAKRLNLINRDLSDIKTICITHEHNDHIRGNQSFDLDVEIIATKKTRAS